MTVSVFVSFIYHCHIVNKRLSETHSEKMRKITFSIWLVWQTISAINAELTLESVYQKVNDLEVEVTVLKVNMTRIVHGRIDHLTAFDPRAQARCEIIHRFS